MSVREEAPLLVVAGVRDEMSLGYAAANRWLEDDPRNQVLMTVRSRKAEKFAAGLKEANEGRVDFVTIDYADPTPSIDASELTGPDDPNADQFQSAVQSLQSKLHEILGDERAVSGVVHSIAGADFSNFITPAHELSPQVYIDTYLVTAVSLLKVVQGVRGHLRDGAGIVTYGYEEPGGFTEDYGGALSTAKVALNQLVRVLAVSLGKETPSARTLEVIPGFVDTYAGTGVALGVVNNSGVRMKPSEMARGLEEYFRTSSALPNTSAEAQRQASGALAVEFIKGGPVFDQMTGETIRVNAGRSILKPRLVPEINPPADDESKG